MTKSKKSDDDNYDDDFEDDIQEDLPDDMNNSDIGMTNKIGESHGITVSQSLGIDPSVDSL